MRDGQHQGYTAVGSYTGVKRYVLKFVMLQSLQPQMKKTFPKK